MTSIASVACRAAVPGNRRVSGPRIRQHVINGISAGEAEVCGNHRKWLDVFDHPTDITMHESNTQVQPLTISYDGWVESTFGADNPDFGRVGVSSVISGQ